MITLNTDAHGLIKIRTWDEIEELPGFEYNLDPKEHELENVIGSYLFPEEIPCGLSTCHQPHKRGYITKTVSGKVTNIGNYCGKKHFGVDFKQQSRAFNHLVIEKGYRENIASFQLCEDDRKSSLDLVRNDIQGDWIYKKSRFLTSSFHGIPDPIYQAVSKLVKSRTSIYYTDRLATKEETEQEEIAQGREISKPHYIQEPLFSLDGIEYLYPENDFKELIRGDLVPNIKAILDIDIDASDFKTLKYWSAWCNTFEEKIIKAKKIVSHGHKLMTKENLCKLALCLNTHKETKAFDKQVNSIFKETPIEIPYSFTL